MGFTLENKQNKEQYGLVKFVFNEPFGSDDMTNVLGILSNLLDLKKTFGFYVDSRNANTPPFNAASKLLQWLKINKTRFKKQLICSAVIYGNTVTNNLLSKLLNGVFMIQPPVRPNKLTNDIEQAEKWIDEKIKEFLSSKNSN
jgi:hypothetical protein